MQIESKPTKSKLGFKLTETLEFEGIIIRKSEKNFNSSLSFFLVQGAPRNMREARRIKGRLFQKEKKYSKI